MSEAHPHYNIIDAAGIVVPAPPLCDWPLLAPRRALATVPTGFAAQCCAWWHGVRHGENQAMCSLGHTQTPINRRVIWVAGLATAPGATVAGNRLSGTVARQKSTWLHPKTHQTGQCCGAWATAPVARVGPAYCHAPHPLESGLKACAHCPWHGCAWVVLESMCPLPPQPLGCVCHPRHWGCPGCGCQPSATLPPSGTQPRAAGHPA